MILDKILDHNYHRSKTEGALSLMVETPVIPQFFPMIVSDTSGNFIISRRIVENRFVRSGVFKNPGSYDDYIKSLFDAAYDLSKSDKFKNIFTKPDLASRYITSESGFKSQPRVVLVPNEFTDYDLKRIFVNLSHGSVIKYGQSRLMRTNISRPTFLSRPDFVGLFTQFPENHASIILHNVKSGISFVEC